MATNAILNCGLTPNISGHECAFHIGILAPLFYFVSFMYWAVLFYTKYTVQPLLYFVSFIAVLSCIILYKIYRTATALFC